ncbi:MAG: ribose 5-phosphate isomerase B [Lactobacillaceae bacterium]|jgi:ribose 5-phosphate isomerase B|nr:ribose 5-phosphate isomerase B [Lactobacillaceae bacterium]
MKIAIGSDHGGFELKQELIEHYKGSDIELVDEGTYSLERCDYPDYARKVVDKVLKGEADKGILICGTGIGMTLIANRFKGIRAALLYSEFAAQAAKEHNNANIIVFGGRTMSKEDVIRYISIFNSVKYLDGTYEIRNKKLDV